MGSNVTWNDASESHISSLSQATLIMVPTTYTFHLYYTFCPHNFVSSIRGGGGGQYRFADSYLNISSSYGVAKI